MSRDLKRVPFDFDWPLNKIWKGYKGPDVERKECTYCSGTGYAPEALKWRNKWYGYMPFSPHETGSIPFLHTHPIIQARAERSIHNSPEYYGSGTRAVQREAYRLAALFNNSWCYHLDQEDVNCLIEKGRLPDLTRKGTYIPTAREVNDWSIDFGFGHDSLNSWICIQGRANRHHFETTCSHCEGSGRVPLTEAEQVIVDAWEDYDPPIGDGWQVWETVSEGSPISPVFKTSDELVNWLIGEGYSEGAAEQFVKVGFALSGMMIVKNGQSTFYNNIEMLNAPQDIEEDNTDD